MVATAASGFALEAGWQRYKVAFQYVGTHYSGWQRNPTAPRPAVQDVVEAAVRALVGEENASPCFVSSRTDAGVHALRNVLHVDLRRRARQVGPEALAPHPPQVVRRALNARLRGTQVAVLDVAAVDADAAAGFHARFSARERRYVYRLVTGRSAFEADRAWCVGRPLDVERMRAAAAALVGRHDFSSFRGGDCQAASPVRTVREVSIRRVEPELLPLLHPAEAAGGYGQLLHVHVRAESFLHHMVRNMVGALQAVGSGRLPVDAMRQILEVRSLGLWACDGRHEMRPAHRPPSQRSRPRTGRRRPRWPRRRACTCRTCSTRRIWRRSSEKRRKEGTVCKNCRRPTTKSKATACLAMADQILFSVVVFPPSCHCSTSWFCTLAFVASRLPFQQAAERADGRGEAGILLALARDPDRLALHLDLGLALQQPQGALELALHRRLLQVRLLGCV